MAYDPDHQLVLVAWDDASDLFVAFLQVSAHPADIQVVTKIPLPDACDPVSGECGIEQPVYDQGLKKFFVAVPATTAHPHGELAVFNPVTLAREPGIGLDGTGCFPHGLALGPRQNVLVGCSAHSPPGTKLNSLVVKATTGTVLLTITQAGGNDEVWYNPGDNNYYLAASSNTTGGCTPAGPVGGCKGGTAAPVLGIVDAGTADSGPNGPKWRQNVPTVAGAHSVAAIFSARCINGNDHCVSPGQGNDIGQRTRAYVPLSTTPLTGTPTEPGGIGIVQLVP
jgi:hypothetical protein